MEKENKIDEYIENKTSLAKINYQALYNKYKNLSNVIFKTKIDTNEIINIFKDAYKSDSKTKAKIRKELYSKLSSTYNILKKYNLKQLHFHLINNESFLRFHRPSKYEDNLTGFRSTVEYVNKTKKPIDGFEEGRIFNGYRFVFPLFDKSNNNKHIGSVEISFSSLAFHTEYMQDYHIASNFLVLKELVDKKVFKSEKGNYINSPFSGFYYEKSVFEQIKNILDKNSLKPDKKDINSIKKAVLNGKTASIYHTKTQILKTFIPVFNPITKKVSAIYVSLDKAPYIFNKTNNFYSICLGLFLFLSLIFYFMYKNSVSKAKLQYLNKNLEKEIEESIQKIRQKDKLLLQQSKNAAMGEMIDAIAHQWKSPLNVIKMSQEMLKLSCEDNNIKDKQTFEYINKTINYTTHLSETLDEFRGFFRPNFKLQEVYLKDIIKATSLLMKDELIKNQIELEYKKTDHTKVFIIPNEFKHVLINLFSNSKDAFIQNNIKNRKISINLKKEKEKIVLNICDNAGGIPSDVIDSVFDPHFTTKDETKGTGIGLYMTKQIIEKIGASITVSNQKDGACFSISFLKYCEV